MEKNKTWTSDEELELDHFYSSVHLSLKELAKRFNCSVGVVRRKIRELGIEQ